MRHVNSTKYMRRQKRYDTTNGTKEKNVDRENDINKAMEKWMIEDISIFINDDTQKLQEKLRHGGLDSGLNTRITQIFLLVKDRAK
jgi:hypothetical protein